jgi:ribosomal protein S27AE
MMLVSQSIQGAPCAASVLTCCRTRCRRSLSGPDADVAGDSRASSLARTSGVRRRSRLPSWQGALPRCGGAIFHAETKLRLLSCLSLVHLSIRCGLPLPAGAGVALASAASMSATDRPPLTVPEVAVAYSRPTLLGAAAVLSSLVACPACGAAVASADHRCRNTCSAAVGDASTDAEGRLLHAACVSGCCRAAPCA